MTAGEFEETWKGICEAFREGKMIRVVSIVRYVLNQPLVASKHYVESYWPDRLEEMREDLLRQLRVGVPETVKPTKVIEDENFSLVVKVKGEVSWEQWNEFLAKAAAELNL